MKNINSSDPYARLRFYVKVDEEYYNTDGTTSTEFDETTVYTTELPKDGRWFDSIYIAPGLIKNNGTVTLPPLEPGHDYTLVEKIVAGNIYEYEFTTQTVRPMVIGEQLGTVLGTHFMSLENRPPCSLMSTENRPRCILKNNFI